MASRIQIAAKRLRELKVAAYGERQLKIAAYGERQSQRLRERSNVFTSFGIGIYNTWGDFSAMGGVFWRTILITTLIGIVLSFVYAPMTWKGYG